MLSEQKWVADPSNNGIAEGLVKRHKPFNPELVVGKRQTNGGWYASDSKNPEEEGSDTVDGLPALANQECVNKERTTDEKPCE